MAKKRFLIAVELMNKLIKKFENEFLLFKKGQSTGEKVLSHLRNVIEVPEHENSMGVLTRKQLQELSSMSSKVLDNVLNEIDEFNRDTPHEKIMWFN